MLRAVMEPIMLKALQLETAARLKALSEFLKNPPA